MPEQGVRGSNQEGSEKLPQDHTREIAESSRLGLYRASLTDPGRRQYITVARTALLDNTMEGLRESIGRKSKHHFLFIGSRGSGKSHFLSLIEDEVVGDATLTEAFHLVRFPEEAYRILSFADFLLGLCEILRDTTSDEPVWTELYDRLRTEEDDELIVDTLVPSIRRANRELKRSLLVMLENVNELFGRQIRDKKDIGALRKFFTTDNACHLIATAQIHFDAITDVGQPFYDFFDVQLVENFTQDETLLFICRSLEWERREDLLRDFDTLRPKLIAMYQMTGGSPRLTVMLYDLVARDSVKHVRDQLQLMLDHITPFYQDRLSDLPPQERAVLETMATMRDQPKTPKKLAARMRMSQAQTSSLLKRLVRSQYLRVHENPEDRRSRLYTIREGFFDIWLAMNLSRRSRSRLSFLIDFFEVFYANTHARERARKEQLARLQHEETGDAIAGDAEVSLDLLSEVGSDSERSRSKLDLARHYATRGNADQSALFIKEANALTRDSLSLWIIEQAGDSPSEDYLSAIQKMIDAWTMHRSGELEGFSRYLQDLGGELDHRTYSEARLAFLTDLLSEADEVDERVRLGLEISSLLEGLARWDEVEERLAIAQEEAILSSNNLLASDVMHRRGHLKMRRGDYDDARALYEEALSIRRRNRDRGRVANTLKVLADLRMQVSDLGGAGRAYEEALSIYREIHARWGEANTLGGLGKVHLAQGCFRESFASHLSALAIQRQVEHKPGEASSHLYLMWTALAAGRSRQAVALGLVALDILTDIWDRFGLMVVYSGLARAFAETNLEASIAATYRSWKLAEEIGDPSQEARAHQLTQVLKDEHSGSAYEELLRDLEENADDWITAALQEVRDAVADGDIAPYRVPPA